MIEFQQLFDLKPEIRVLDVGGSPNIWTLIPIRPHLTIVNLTPPPEECPSDIQWIIADGRFLPFCDQGFDIVFSNSVIEHLGTFEDQIRFAEEIRRVGRRYYVQTSAKYFPIEPHFLTPMVQFMPKPLQLRIVRNFTVWGLLTRPSHKEVEEAVYSIRLLTKKEMKILFPDAHLLTERLLGLPKSYIAVKN